MAMTTTQIWSSVTDRWQELGLGLANRPVGWHLADIQTRLAEVAASLNEPGPDVSNNMLWVLANAWAMLRWRGDLPEDHHPLYWEPGDATPTSAVNPLPREAEIDSYPLAITGVQYHTLQGENYAMMAASYLHILESEWMSDTTNLWTDTSTTTTRYLFEICKNYSLRYGVAES